MATDKKRVIVTAFGPFCGFECNPSEEVVRCLEDLAPVQDDVELITDLLQVDYDAVAETVPQLWEKYSPTLVIHVGVHPRATQIHLEQTSFKFGYCAKDIKGRVPCDNRCLTGSDAKLRTGLDVLGLVHAANDEFTEDGEDELLVTSHNPGRFLCAFSFYVSLSIDNRRCLFVHIPAPTKQLPAQRQAEIIKFVIMRALGQLEEIK